MSSSLPTTTSTRTSNYEKREEEEDLSFLEKFRYINGRRFHNEESTINYYIPNDLEESKRVNLQHYLLRYVWKGNYSSPMTEKLKERKMSVLDIGCGPGIWSLDMAQKYPKSSFVGIDISTMYPSQDKTPLNVIFLQHNILEGLPWPTDTFDFVYKRFLALSFTSKDLVKAINEITRITKIDGWIEIMNYEYSLKNCGKVTKKLMEKCVEFHQSKNIFISSMSKVKKIFEDNGKITDIQCEENFTPVGKWSGLIGELALINFMAAFNGFKIFLAPFMKITIEQFDALLNEIEKEFNDNQSYVLTYRVFGRKSLDDICDT